MGDIPTKKELLDGESLTDPMVLDTLGSDLTVEQERKLNARLMKEKGGVRL